MNAFEGWMVGKPCSFQPHSRGMTRYFCEILASVRAGLVVAKRWSIGRRHASSKSRNPFQPLPTWTQSVGTLFRPLLLRNRSYFQLESLQTSNLKRFAISSLEVVVLSFSIARGFCPSRILHYFPIPCVHRRNISYLFNVYTHICQTNHKPYKYRKPNSSWLSLHTRPDQTTVHKHQTSLPTDPPKHPNQTD